MNSHPGEARPPREPIWQDLRDNPQHPELARLLGISGRLSAAHVQVSLVRSALETNGEEHVVAAWLSPEERSRYATLKQEKRRVEWLPGRMVAKQAVRLLLGKESPPAAQIVIRRGPNGAPNVTLAGELSAPLPRVSIAHSKDVAVALAATDAECGVDVQAVELGTDQIRARFATTAEVETMADASQVSRTLALNLLWGAKEAARKVAGATDCTMLQMRLRHVRADGDHLVCALTDHEGRALRAVVFQRHAYCYAAAAPAVETTAEGPAK